MWKEEATSESIDNGRMNSAEKIVLSNPINVLKAIYILVAELAQMPVLTAHYGELLYKTCLYGEFLNLYGGGKRNSILTTGIPSSSTSYM